MRSTAGAGNGGIALGIAIVNLGLFLPDGFLLPLVRPFQLRSPFRTLLLAYFPALGGMVLLMLYTFRAPREPQPPPPLHMTLRD